MVREVQRVGALRTAMEAFGSPVEKKNEFSSILEQEDQPDPGVRSARPPRGHG